MLWLVAGVLLTGLPVARAQQVLAASSSAPPPGAALPPPGINEPGSREQSIPLPNTGLRPSVAPAARQPDANGQTSDVAVSTNANGDVVEEYSRNGVVYMVRVTPRHGVTQTYMYNSPDGSLLHNPKLGPVSPVYYTIYQWGGPRKPAGSSAPPPQPPSSSG